MKTKITFILIAMLFITLVVTSCEEHEVVEPNYPSYELPIEDYGEDEVEAQLIEPK